MKASAGQPSDRPHPDRTEAFARWCAERGVEPGSAARVEYVSEKSAERR